jgi:hypothetical protein
MNYIDRRTFMKNLAATLVASTAGLTLNSCGTTRAGYKPLYGEIDHDEVLASFREQSRQISKAPNLGIMEEYFRSKKCNPYLIQDSIISLLAVGTFGDLPKKDREHPAAQQIIRDAHPAMDRAVLSATTFLESLSQKERIEIQETLKTHPEIIRTFQLEFDAAARQKKVAPNRLDHFNSIFNKCAWQLENQDPSLLIDKIVTMTDKTCKDCQITPEQRRAIVADLSCMDCYDIAFAGEGLGTESTMGKPAENDSLELMRAIKYRSAKKVRNTGAGMILFGLIQFGLGLLIATNSDMNAAAFFLGAVIGATGGAIVVIAGIITALVGAIKMSQYRLDNE